MFTSFRQIHIAVGLSLLATAAAAQQPAREPLEDPPSTRAFRVVADGLPAVPSLADRDPDAAFRRALMFPGGGHFYTGEATKGAVLLGVAAGGLLVGALMSGDGSYDVDRHEYSRGRTPLVIGAGVAAGSWLYGMLDARASAARVNRRLGLLHRDIDARLAIVPGVTDPVPYVALRVSW